MCIVFLMWNKIESPDYGLSKRASQEDIPEDEIIFLYVLCYKITRNIFAYFAIYSITFSTSVRMVSSRKGSISPPMANSSR